jgi:hypothetical protein
MTLLFTCGSVLARDDAPPPEPAAVAQSPSDDNSADNQHPQPSADEIAAWIADLDSNRYRTRERATQHLVTAGVGAMEPLLAAANGDRPEPADRAVWILRRMAESPELELRRAAVEQLVQVEGRPQVVAEAQEILTQIAHEVAVLAIEQLGGRYLEDGDDPNWGQPMAVRRVVLDDQWRGGDDGLVHLTKLHDVPLVMVIGADVSRQGVAQLAQLESLAGLWLYGTRLTDRDVAALREQMPGVEIDYRRGALLGVRGSDGGGAAIVQAVQPDTAAAVAGIRNGDVIRKYNGEPVSDFKHLTSKIAQNMPGDTIKLEIIRANQPLEIEVTLGRWKSR